jgi:hypothetical protein
MYDWIAIKLYAKQREKSNLCTSNALGKEHLSVSLCFQASHDSGSQKDKISFNMISLL